MFYFIMYIVLSSLIGCSYYFVKTKYIYISQKNLCYEYGLAIFIGLIWPVSILFAFGFLLVDIKNQNKIKK